MELVGTDSVCDAENLRRIGDVFERYGSFGEGSEFLFLVSSCKTRNPKPLSHYPSLITN